MPEKLHDTWHSRELPVLREVVRLHDESIGRPVRVGAIERALELSADDIQRALNALATDALIDTEGDMQKKYLTISRVTGEARRLAGSWPTDQTAADRILAALEAVAVDKYQPEATRSRARAILEAASGVGRDLIVAVGAAAITGQIPGSNS